MTHNPAQEFPNRKKWINLIKTIFTLGLLAAILNQLRHLSIENLLRILNWRTFFFSFLVLVAHNLLGTWRWHTIIRKFRIKVKYPKLLKFYYIGSFVGFFLPTSIGGDVARIFLLRREVQSLEVGSSTVIVERILGLFSILLLFASSLMFGANKIIEISLFWPVTFFIIIFIFGLWVLFYLPENWLKKILFLSPKINLKIQNIFRELKSFRNETTLILEGLILSILFQSAMIIVYYLLSLSINLRIPFQYFLLFMPPVWVLSLIPLSLNGLGIREGAFIYLFSLLGYSTEQLSFVSVLGVSLLIIQGLIGGIIVLFEKGERNLLKEIKQ